MQTMITKLYLFEKFAIGAISRITNRKKNSTTVGVSKAGHV